MHYSSQKTTFHFFVVLFHSISVPPARIGKQVQIGLSASKTEKKCLNHQIELWGTEICQSGCFDGLSSWRKGVKVANGRQGGDDIKLATVLASFNNSEQHDPPSDFLFLFVLFWINTTKMTEKRDKNGVQVSDCRSDNLDLASNRFLYIVHPVSEYLRYFMAKVSKPGMSNSSRLSGRSDLSKLKAGQIGVKTFF